VGVEYTVIVFPGWMSGGTPGAGDTVEPRGTGTWIVLFTLSLVTHSAVCVVALLATVGGTSKVYRKLVLLNMEAFTVPDGWVIELGSRANEYK
jgi:hypothetical protein